MYHYIYKTTCLITGRYYYGMHSTTNLDDGYIGSGKLLMRSIKKHGVSNHAKEIIASCQSRKELQELEKSIITESMLQDPLCMNLKLGGEGGGQRGIKRSVATRARMSDARRKLLLDGWSMPATSIDKIRKKSIGRKHTDETKRKMSESHKGAVLPPFSEEHKARLSEARRKRVITDITRARISDSMRDNPNNKGWNLSPETRLRQVDAVRRALTKVPKEIVTCPWCGKTGGKPAMNRFHMDNCKMRKDA